MTALDRVCYVQTLPLGGVITQLDGYDFNSFCNVDGKLYAANEDGLYLITGNKFSAADINSYVEFYIDFEQVIRIRSMWIGMESADDMALTLTFGDQTANATTYTLTPYRYSNQQNATKIFIGRNLYGRYLRLRVANVDGGDFSLDFIEAIIIVRGRVRT